MKRIAHRLEKRFGLEQTHNLKAKHVEAIFTDLIAEGLDPSTLSGDATAFRMIARAIGKKNIVPRTNRELGFSGRGMRFRPIEANMAFIQSVRKELYNRAEWLGLAQNLRQNFGPRVKESLLSVDVIVINNIEYLVVKGSKGNRPRLLPILTEEQIDVIQRVKLFVQNNGQKSLVPVDKTLKQAYDRQRNELHRMGANKAVKVHAHSLRYNYAQLQKEKGVLEEDLVKLMGHGRTQTLKCYCS